MNLRFPNDAGSGPHMKQLWKFLHHGILPTLETVLFQSVPYSHSNVIIDTTSMLTSMLSSQACPASPESFPWTCYPTPSCICISYVNVIFETEHWRSKSQQLVLSFYGNVGGWDVTIVEDCSSHQAWRGTEPPAYYFQGTCKRPTQKEVSRNRIDRKLPATKIRRFEQLISLWKVEPTDFQDSSVGWSAAELHPSFQRYRASCKWILY